MSGRGAFVISIDVELAWGTCDRPLTPAARRALGLERAIVSRLLRLFRRYDVRASWAVVGHLLIGDCARDGERVHPEIPRPVPTASGRDWFFQHPPVGGDRAWYGRDLVERIVRARPRQEIASHSFCHLPYDEVRTPRAAVQADVRAARAAHAAAGLPFDTFVFPRNVIGFTGLLAEAGVLVYRGHTRAWYDAIPVRAVRRALDALAFVLPLPVPTVTPRVDAAGLLDVPDSMLLYSRSGAGRLVPPRRVAAKAAGALARAAARGDVFHLWFHPANFVERTEEQLRILEAILRSACGLRAAGRLDMVTLQDLRGAVRPRAAAPGAPGARPATVFQAVLDECRRTGAVLY
jgi:peptidoglycan/xylan/chitin deacetylase (PgdA/CDA1 family)